MNGATKRSASRPPEDDRERKRLATYSPEEGEVDDVDGPPTGAQTPRPTLTAPVPSASAANAVVSKVKFPFKKKADSNGSSQAERAKDDSRRGRPQMQRPAAGDHWEPGPGRREERGNGAGHDTWRPPGNDRYYEGLGHDRRHDVRRRSPSRSRERRRRTYSHSPSSRSSHSSVSPRPRHRLPVSHAPPPPRYDIYRPRSPRREDLLAYDVGRYAPARSRGYPPDESRRWPESSYRPRSPTEHYRPLSPLSADTEPRYRPASPKPSPKPSLTHKAPSPTPREDPVIHQPLPSPPPPPGLASGKDASLPATHETVTISLNKPRLPPPPSAPKNVHSPTPLPPPPVATPVPKEAAVEVAPPAPRPSGVFGPARPMPFWIVKSRSMPRSREEEAKVYGRTFAGCGHQDDYDMTRKLGEGTFGEVHKAKQKATGRSVALKRILMHNEKEGMPVTALREIKILKALRHKNVIELLDMFVIHSGKGEAEPLSVYMVFPYMDHDLAGLLENPRVSLTPSHIKLYMKQLLEGTEYMHNNRILHRDMKAANLLISNDGSLKIADFGLARSYDPVAAKLPETDTRGRDRRYTNCVVTRWYRPPELLLGARRYGGEIDMWGVGCVLGEMFHRRPILCGQSDIDQLEKIWTMCGTPNQHTWPNFDLLPGCEGIKHFNYRQRQMKTMFDSLGPETFDLLDRLLTCNPQQRVTATEALKHDYFWTDPLPADPKTLPQYEASHEFDKRSRRHMGPLPMEVPQQAHGLPPPHGPPGPYNRGGPPPHESFRPGPYPSNGPPPVHSLPPPTNIAYPSRLPPPPQQFGPPIHFPRAGFAPPGAMPPAPHQGPYAAPSGQYSGAPGFSGPMLPYMGPPPPGFAVPPPMQGHNAPPPTWERPSGRSGFLPRPPDYRTRDARSRAGRPPPPDALPYD